MSARLTALAMQYAEQVQWRGSRPENPRHAIRLTARPGQSIWTGCDKLERSQLPAGHVFIDAPLAEGGLPDITITPGLTSGTANISGGVYRLLDDLNLLGDWLADKALNRVQMFGGTIEQFDLGEDDDLNDPITFQRCLRYTFRVSNTIKIDDSVYEFNCEDVKRDLDVEIFNKEPFRLHSTIGTGTTTIRITLPVDEADDHDYTFEHGPDYLIRPGEHRGLLLINGEYIGYGGLVELTIAGEQVLALVDPERAMFGTERGVHEVGDETPIENRPKMEHVAYAEESPASLALAVATNKFLDGRTWTHGLNLGAEWFDIPSYAEAADDRRRTVLRTKSIVAKKYLEEHVLARMPAILIPAPTGKLRMQQVSFRAQPTARNILDESTCYGGDLSALTIDAKDCKKTLILKWDKDSIKDEYRQEVHIIDLVSNAETQATDDVEYECENITTSRSTESEVKGIGATLWAKHALPVKRLSADLTRELWHVLPGEALLVRHYPKDYKNGSSTVKPIDTPMLVGTIRDRQRSSKFSVDLIGYQAPPASLLQGSLPLPESVYMENGLPLPGVVDGVASGSPTINLNQKYYYLDDLTWSDSWAPNYVGYGDLELWVRGVFLWAASVDGKGLGMPPGVGGYHVAPPAAGPWEAAINYPTDDGGNIQTGGGPRQITVRSHPASIAVGRQQSTLAEQVNVERGRLVGVPASLAGSGGADGEISRSRVTKGYTRDLVSSVDIAGSTAAHGGMGGKIVCFPGSGMVGSGSLDCSGADGTIPAVTSIGIGYTTAVAAAGAGGAHGHWAFYTDGIGTPFQGINASSFIAKDGQSLLPGNRAESSTRLGRVTAPWRGYYDPPQDDSNKWLDAHTIGILPPSQVATDTNYSSAFSEFFEDQPDGRSRVRVQVARPGDGNRWDLWITPNNLSIGGTTPELYVFGSAGYELVDWETTPYATVYHAMLGIARRGGSVLHYGDTRPQVFSDGDEWVDSATEHRWILYESKADVLIGSGDYLVGANKWADSNLAKYPDEQSIYVFDDLDLMPLLPKGSTEASTGGEVDGEFGTPVNVSATSTVDAVTLTWDPVATATKYNIDRATGTGPYTYLTTITDANHVDSTVADGIAYRYRINAITGPVGAERYSAWSQVVEITAEVDGTGNGTGGNDVSPVTGFAARVESPTEIELTWHTVDGVDGYRILRAGSLIATVAQSVTSFDDTGLSAGVAYSYSIRAYDGADESESASTTATTSQGEGSGDLTAPEDLSVTIYSSTAAELFWTAVPPGHRGIGNAYEIEQDGVHISVYNDANVSSHFMGNLIPDTAYNWRLRFVGGGDTSDWVVVSGSTPV